MTGVTISSEALQAIVEKSIIEGLTVEQKMELLDAAIREMVTPKPVYGGRKSESVLGNAIEDAIRTYTHAAAERFMTDDVRARIDQLVKDGIAKAVSEEKTFSESVAKSAGEAMEKAVRGY